MILRIVAAIALFVTLGVALVGAPAGVSAVACDPCAGFVLENLNLREGPSLDDDVIEVMPAGSEIEYSPLTPAENGFEEVTYGEQTGWASMEFLLLFPASGVVLENLNLRDGPSLDDTVLEVMPAGVGLMVLGGPTDGYYSVDFEGTVGYAFGDYLEFVNAPALFVAGDLVITTDRLRLRDSGDLDGDILVTLDEGVELEIVSGPVAADGYTWYEVDAGEDGTGFVAGEFLQLA